MASLLSKAIILLIFVNSTFVKCSAYHIFNSVVKAMTCDVQPQQIHLSFGPDKIRIVTWSTVDHSNTISVVEYGFTEEQLNQTATGKAEKFTDGGKHKRTQYIHRVQLKDLLPGTKYYYRCGGELGWSAVFHFSSFPESAAWSPRLAVYGDLGADNPQSVPRLQKEAQEGLYDAILHVGDFGYDLHEDNGQQGDRFMRIIEPIAAYVPYMTSVGNHEEKYNFSHYKARFSMPGTENGLYYSFNLGSAHFIFFSTEFYYFLKYGLKQVALQYEWLRQDLREANAKENRTIRPWIITLGHRPMYCSDDDGDDCTNKDTLIRVGLPLVHWFPLEPLFYEYGVDLNIWAHEHSYERLWPVYNRSVSNGSLESPYSNPKAPVHVISGSAGCREEKDHFLPDMPPWTAFRSNDYGYARLLIANKTHLYMEQVSDDQGGHVIDNFWISKDHPYGYRRNFSFA